jgi:GNAT superfamily N-acetyltransferase
MDMHVVPFDELHFKDIQELNRAEGWTQLVERNDETFNAWKNSNVAYVVIKNERIEGYIRGLTDENVTIYICEMLISKNLRGQGVGSKLLNFVHGLYPQARIEMLASSTSHTFYESLKFRPFYGFRKTIEE